MAQNSVTQMTLVKSSLFLARLQYILCQQAQTVLTETGIGSTHVARAAFAKSILANPYSVANGAIAVYMVGSTNIVSTVVGNVDPNQVDSSASDAAILSQIASSWNILAGIDTGN